MKRFYALSFYALVAVGLLVGPASAGITVDAGDSSAPWFGFMNVYNLPAPAGDGAFQFASAWGVPDLVATFDDPNSTVTLSPNTIGDPDPYWYIGGGGPGAPGNKIMEANLYLQVDDGSLSGDTVTFQGTVVSNTYTAAHAASIFIRDFAPDFSSFNETIVPATPGGFSIDLLTDPGAGRHVQYGFQSVGENVWVTDTAPFGNVVFGAVPEPASLALLGLGGIVVLRRRR
ncbi:MAG: PEP-CTERM sorting domain-containing protein [bacterium]|nr:PEP-CTERM sorting domain-containing protein [bacterium]